MATWNFEICLPTKDALCREHSTHPQLWLPTGDVDVPDNWNLIPQSKILRIVNETSACMSANSGRAIRVNDTQYEVSLCDIMDMGLDIVYMRMPSNLEYFNDNNALLLWRKDSTPIYEYVAIAIVAIFLVSSVSQNISDMFTTAHDVITYWTEKQSKVSKQKKKTLHVDAAHSEDNEKQDLDFYFLDSDDDEIMEENIYRYIHQEEKEIETQQKQNNPKQLPNTKSAKNTINSHYIQSVFIFSSWVYLVFTFNVIHPGIIIALADQTLLLHFTLYVPLALLLNNLFAIENTENRLKTSIDKVPGHNISIIVAILCMMSVRIHYTFDNPYTFFLGLLFGWRTFIKIMMCGRSNKVQTAFTVVELFLLFSIISNGISQTSFSSTQAYIKCTSSIAIMALAGVATSELFGFIFAHQDINSKENKI